MAIGPSSLSRDSLASYAIQWPEGAESVGYAPALRSTNGPGKLEGRAFTSLEHMQAEAVSWSLQVAGRRQCRPLDGAAPLAVFEALESAELLPLPRTPFVLARWSTATVGPDIHIKIGRTLYSVPWKLIGRKVDVRSTATMV